MAIENGYSNAYKKHPHKIPQLKSSIRGLFKLPMLSKTISNMSALPFPETRSLSVQVLQDRAKAHLLLIPSMQKANAVTAKPCRLMHGSLSNRCQSLV